MVNDEDKSRLIGKQEDEIRRLQFENEQLKRELDRRGALPATPTETGEDKKIPPIPAQQNGQTNGTTKTRTNFSPRSNNSNMKYILVTGGVISGVGKGIVSSSLGVILKGAGYRVSAIKIDPYINIDAGTFSPYEHGEVFVLDDGGEVDLDLGNYERFLGLRLTRDNNLTMGKLFQHVTMKERRGDYHGKTVQLIPHTTDAIIDWIERVAHIPVDGSDETPEICIVELGGTVGDHEGAIFFAAFERFQRPSARDHLMVVHVSLLLYPEATGEPKTKPMQNSVRNMRSAGLVPDLLVCRSTDPLSEKLRGKIADFAQLDINQVVGVHDVSNIYKVPLLLSDQGLLDMMEKRLALSVRHPIVTPEMTRWKRLADEMDSFKEQVHITLVGKYTSFTDAYASLNKSLSHAAIRCKRRLVQHFVESQHLEKDWPNEKERDAAWETVRKADGIIVPGGFDRRGVEGMILACEYARVNKKPFLGVCLGMQCATIEFARNVLKISNANSAEFDPTLPFEKQVVVDMPEHAIQAVGLGGTMRLGARTTVFLAQSGTVYDLYGRRASVRERHRHRYEVNPQLVPQLARAGLLFVGMGVDEETQRSKLDAIRSSASSNDLVQMAAQGAANQQQQLLATIDALCERGGDGKERPAVRMEIMELNAHPYYVGVQYHPEYLSSPLAPSPPFLGLLAAASGQLDEHREAAARSIAVEYGSLEALKLSALAIRRASLAATTAAATN